MAYRTPARALPGDTALCCIRCGALTSVSFAQMRDGDFRCSKCGHEQRVLREVKDATIEDLRLSDYGIGSYDELTPFAKELGKDVQTSGLDLLVDGIECKIGLNINSGTVMGLDHHAMTTGLPPMRFVTEVPEHGSAKAQGVIKEVQTGDSEFDDQVYIESSASDADVLTVLSPPAVRKAIRVLLVETPAIVVEETGIAFYSSKDQGFEPKTIRHRLAWLRVLAGAPRPLVTEMVPVPRAARIAKNLMGWTYPVAILLTILGLAKWMPLRAELLAVFVAFGVLFGLVMLPVWSRLLRGRSTSHREIRAWRISSFVYGPLLVIGLATSCNGACDGSESREVTMKIVSVTKGTGDDDDTWHARTVDEEGQEHSYAFKSAPAVGQWVKVRWKEGAFGWRWESSDPIVVEADKR